MKTLVQLIGIGLAANIAYAQPANNPVIFSVGGWNVPLDEFQYIYRKNNAHDSDYNTPQSIRRYLDLYQKFKLKVKAARDAGYDTAAAFRREVETYRDQLIQPYFFDDSTLEHLMREAYDRLKWELRAAHILISLPANPTPADTLAAYQKSLQIRREIMEGLPFDSAALRYSQDPSVSFNKGDLGWFTAFHMVYPFETGAYRLKVGEVSQPVRTQFGYHLIKLLDKRRYRGDIEVAHILIKTPPNTDTAGLRAARAKADSIYHLVAVKKMPFEQVAQQFSEDPSSAPRGGRLPRFNSFARFMPEPVKDAAFALEIDGAISKPVQSSYGFHILKRIRHYPLPPYESVKPFLRRRIQEDPQRRIIPEQTALESVKRRLGFKMHPRAQRTLDKARFLDTTILQTNRSLRPRHLRKPLFTLSALGKTYRVADFVDWMRRQKIRLEDDSLLTQNLRRQFEAFVKATLRKDLEQYLLQHDPDFRYLLQEYEEGMLLFNIMQDSVWHKALTDTAGVAAYYEAHKHNYRHNGKWQAIVYECHNLKACDDIEEQLRNGQVPSQEQMIRYNSGGPRVTYSRGEFYPGEHPAIDKALQQKTDADAFPYVARIDINGIFYLVYIEKYIPPGIEPLDNVRGRVIADYQDALEAQWVERLKKRYPIVVNESALRRLLP